MALFILIYVCSSLDILTSSQNLSTTRNEAIESLFTSITYFLVTHMRSGPLQWKSVRHLYFLLKKSTFLDKFPLFTTQWNENGNWSLVHLKIPFNLFRWQNIERNKLKVIAELKTAGNSHLKLHINFRSHMYFRCPVFRSYFEMFAQILMVAFSNSVLS